MEEDQGAVTLVLTDLENRQTMVIAVSTIGTVLLLTFIIGITACCIRDRKKKAAKKKVNEEKAQVRKHFVS